MPLLLAAALVTIRIYNYAGVPAEQLAAARAAADQIFHEAGMSLAWIDCRVPGGDASATCAEPLTGREFVLRLRHTPGAKASGHTTLGSSLVDLSAGSGVLITVDPSLVSEIAGEARADYSIVLGRAIAHEVGHLLIGTSSHARTGLMRALWTQGELRGNRPADWRFLPEEAEVMRQGHQLGN